MNFLRRLVRQVCALESEAHPDYLQLEEVLYLSFLGAGENSPNPLVCAKIVRDSEEVGVGIHRFYGREHAETLALQMAKDKASGADVFVNLEPCNHFGHQPPCTKALADAKVKRVVFAGYDPNPMTFKQAKEALGKVGIEAKGPLLPISAGRLNDAYYYHQLKARPFVCLKLAVSLDGRMALKSGDSKWISSKVSRGYAHFLRQYLDAVLVGIGTVMADNPRLTVRKQILKEFLGEDVERIRIRQPVRVVLDPSFSLLKGYDLREAIQRGSAYAKRLGQTQTEDEERIEEMSEELKPPPLNIFIHVEPTRKNRPWLIIVGRAGELGQPQELPTGVEVLAVSSDSQGRIDFRQVWEELIKLGIYSVLVEGGSKVAQSILKQRAFSRLDLVYSPLILGSSALAFSPELELLRIEEAKRLHHPLSFQLGRDSLFSLYAEDWLSSLPS